MKKGSVCRKCHVCGKIVLWLIPTDEEVLGFHYVRTKTLPNYGGNDGHGYVCKDHAKKA